MKYKLDNGRKVKVPFDQIMIWKVADRFGHETGQILTYAKLNDEFVLVEPVIPNYTALNRRHNKPAARRMKYQIIQAALEDSGFSCQKDRDGRNHRKWTVRGKVPRKISRQTIRNCHEETFVEYLEDGRYFCQAVRTLYVF